MTKKKTAIPKKKAIKKPKYIKYLAIWFAIFLAVSMAASYFVIEVCRQNARTKALSKWNSYTQELTKIMNDYASADNNGDLSAKNEDLERLRLYLCRRYAENMNEFCGAYADDKRIAETPQGACAGVVVNMYDVNEDENDNEDEHDEVFFLESSEYLEPLYKSGKYDPVKNANLIEVYSVESDTLKSLAERLGLMPAIYSYSYQDIYINRETHTFLPGKIAIFKGEGENVSEEPIATIDCTPKDTKGYESINEPLTYNGYMNPSMTDINDAQSITNDTEFDISYDMSVTFLYWEVLTVPAEMYCNKACFKALPLTTALVLIIAGLVALLLAVTVSSIIYSSKKAVWEIFEYRKKTTAAMAHDLKTPLAAMSAYAENLEYDIDSDKRAYYSSKVRENVAFMNKTIESILMFTKSETGTAKSVARDIDVHALIEAEYNAVAELFEKKNIKVEIKGEGHVKSNKELIDQAVRNLVGNATKYARPDTTVDIVIDSKGFTMTNLTDQKIKNVKDLKKPFVKGEESRDAEGGAGLGLSIVENCLLSAGHSLDIGFEDETFKAAVRW